MFNEIQPQSVTVAKGVTWDLRGSVQQLSTVFGALSVLWRGSAIEQVRNSLPNCDTSPKSDFGKSGGIFGHFARSDWSESYNILKRGVHDDVGRTITGGSDHRGARSPEQIGQEVTLQARTSKLLLSACCASLPSSSVFSEYEQRLASCASAALGSTLQLNRPAGLSVCPCTSEDGVLEGPELRSIGSAVC